ncbi:MAG: 2,3,4,5-tetrahydropyridine-2,6-dicarboxylate N-succinyltransferase [Bdellovibrionales bacterium]
MSSITLIENAFDQGLDPNTKEITAAVEETIQKIDQGQLRVCEKQGSEWKTNAWVKKAILLYFRIKKMEVIKAGDLQFFDKIPLKKWTGQEGVRVVPHALVRFGAFVSPGAILMPSYVNIGAFVGKGSMVDTWATVGSCAQIGENVHLSGGVGIGGVLEPAQASPVIIGDNAFIGSRCIIVEGVRIGEGAVLGAGVTLTASTKIIDVSGPTEKILQGHVPAQSVVIPGSITKKFPAGAYGVNCALIIGQRKASTDMKTSLNQALRDFEVSV